MNESTDTPVLFWRNKTVSIFEKLCDIFLKMVDNPLPYDLTISLLGSYEIK